MKKKTKIYPWNPVDYLKTEEDMMQYIEAAREDSDPALVAAVLDDIARARALRLKVKTVA